MTYDEWRDTVEGSSCMSHLVQHGVPTGFAVRVLRAAYTSGQLSGRCEGMSAAMEAYTRADAKPSDVPVQESEQPK